MKRSYEWLLDARNITSTHNIGHLA